MLEPAVRRRLLPKIGICAIGCRHVPPAGVRDGGAAPGKPKGGTPGFDGYATLMAVAESHMHIWI